MSLVPGSPVQSGCAGRAGRPRLLAHLSALAALAVAALSLLAVPAFAAAAAGPSARSDAGVLQMCDGVYALCDAATCTPIPEQKSFPGVSQPNPSHALCACIVERGKNLGPGPCSDRVPQGDKHQYIVSTYSFALPNKAYLTCPAGGARTVCFGYPCVIDEKDPKRAH